MTKIIPSVIFNSTSLPAATLLVLSFLPNGSTSNVASSKAVELKITGGIIFVIRDVNLMIKYDLF